MGFAQKVARRGAEAMREERLAARWFWKDVLHAATAGGLLGAGGYVVAYYIDVFHLTFAAARALPLQTSAWVWVAGAYVVAYWFTSRADSARD